MHQSLDGLLPQFDTYTRVDERYGVGVIERPFFRALLRGLDRDDRIDIALPRVTGELREGAQAFPSGFTTPTWDEWVVHLEDVDACIAPALP